MMDENCMEFPSKTRRASPPVFSRRVSIGKKKKKKRKPSGETFLGTKKRMCDDVKNGTNLNFEEV